MALRALDADALRAICAPDVAARLTLTTPAPGVAARPIRPRALVTFCRIELRAVALVLVTVLVAARVMFWDAAVRLAVRAAVDVAARDDETVFELARVAVAVDAERVATTDLADVSADGARAVTRAADRADVDVSDVDTTLIGAVVFDVRGLGADAANAAPTPQTHPNATNEI